MSKDGIYDNGIMLAIATFMYEQPLKMYFGSSEINFFDDIVYPNINQLSLVNNNHYVSVVPIDDKCGIDNSTARRSNASSSNADKVLDGKSRNDGCY